MNIGLHVV